MEDRDVVRVWYVAWCSRNDLECKHHVLFFRETSYNGARERFIRYMSAFCYNIDDVLYSIGGSESDCIEGLRKKISEGNMNDTENNKEDDYRDTSNYHGVSGVYEPILVMEYLADEYVKRGIPPHDAMNLAIAVKYLMRLGSKDDVKKELFKAENFIHRVRVGKWMDPETGSRDSK